MSSRSCPGGFNDPEELLPMCYKCSSYSSHLRGNNCPTCQQDYIFSFVSFGQFWSHCSISFTKLISFFWLLSCRNITIGRIQSRGRYPRPRGRTLVDGTAKRRHARCRSICWHNDTWRNCRRHAIDARSRRFACTRSHNGADRTLAITSQNQILSKSVAGTAN